MSRTLDLDALTDLAVQATRSAGAVIRVHAGTDVAMRRKVGGNTLASQVVTDVDLAAERAIVEVLRPSCGHYGLGLLTEETPDDGERHVRAAFWCVDPLDGTLAFARGEPGYSVSIALVARDGTPLVGVVYDPGADVLYWATRGRGVYRNGVAWTYTRANDYLTLVTDTPLRDSPHRAAIELALHPYAAGLAGPTRELSRGGAVLNAIRVAELGPAVMLKPPKPEPGGGSLWDYAATACVFGELGLPATDFAGGRLDLNPQGGTFMNGAGVRYLNG